ncbi:hypothetical protein ESA_01569 [Cronobacter sakazakii ATCC BAA-894]|uniref:Uncharacterized protein n=1 Tax=Cronobacter sakazakii (strain ATCC BAA-894) TaxID=290339 RepID=A7MN98_CROS8|nr:hypothetical protein ESA_01569 [Cronobacter sakazakii ATCC BAA-894]
MFTLWECSGQQMIFLGKLMGQVFKHIKYRRGFCRRQPLFVHKIFAAKDEYAIFLLNVGGHHAGNIVFMLADHFIGLRQQRSAIDRLS